ncbi:hypothetical protein PIB30_102896 [Stylosanthes scabra]|uniref:Uncharacterized protein n=1 Tax=Stylosanthes scabra TaxID=79078 RepID=A0ABU6ZWN3_9FABA|nr:hypothetical protein [Stylosanthes scabra]
MSGLQGKTNHPKLDRYDMISTRSHEDLDHPKLYKQGGIIPSRAILTHINLLLFHSSRLRRRACPPKRPSYSEDRSIVSEIWAEEIPINNEGAGESSNPQPTPEKEIDQRDQTIRQLETALRELLERQTREAAIATEAMKRAEELARKQ